MQNPKSQKCVIYVRANDDTTAKHQLGVLRRHAANLQMGVTAFHVDSGPKPSRKSLRALNHQLRAGAGSTLVVHNLDAIFESVTQTVKFLHTLIQFKVEFISLADHIHLSSHNSNLIETLMKVESNKKREAIRQGIMVARLSGRRIGRASVVTPELVDEVLRLRSTGISIRRIETMLNRRLSKSVIGRICSNGGTK